MPRRRCSIWLTRGSLLASCLALGVVMMFGGAGKPVLRTFKLDPNAPQFELFDAIDKGLVDARLQHKDEFSGQVFLENKSDEDVTIKLPDGVVGVQVFKQFAPPGGAAGGGLAGGGANQGGNQQGGQAQNTGGGFGGQGGFGGGQGGFGGGGFLGGPGNVPPEDPAAEAQDAAGKLPKAAAKSGKPAKLLPATNGMLTIPAGRTVAVPMTSVCLDHGKPHPNIRMTYRLAPVEEHTKNVALQELIKMIGTGKLDRAAAQAAAWHLSSGLSFEELAAKTIKRPGEPEQPYFHPAQLAAARSLVGTAEGLAREKNKEQQDAEPANPRVRTDKRI